VKTVRSITYACRAPVGLASPWVGGAEKKRVMVIDLDLSKRE
jgi:hypothetical protein